MTTTRRIWFALALSWVTWAGDYTALDRYVATPDATYSYKLVQTTKTLGVTIHQIDLTSQTWLTTALVDRPEWHHWLTIYRPDRITTRTAALYIDGGSNRSTPDSPNVLLAGLAVASSAVVVQLAQVPNQPLKFADETASRSEDAIIAYSWAKYLSTGDEKWPLRLPMTKAAVRAMDAATAFLATPDGGGVTISNFIVAGGSKRGWTTWTTAAVDSRVIAIAPLVIDILNMGETFAHHWKAYGFWAPAVQDYVDAGIMSAFTGPRMNSLLEIEDPYQYRSRFMIPKYMINAAGDQFFLPDSSQFSFGDLPGEKYLRYVPNADHYLESLEAATNLVAWMQAILTNYPRPRFYWTTDRLHGTLTLRTVDRPTKVLLWQATNPKARDFRLETIGPAYKSTAVQGVNGTYTVTVPAPATGWTAFFLELTYPGVSQDLPLVFTTEVVVSPDVYPFPSPFPKALPRRK